MDESNGLNLEYILLLLKNAWADKTFLALEKEVSFKAETSHLHQAYSLYPNLNLTYNSAGIILQGKTSVPVLKGLKGIAEYHAGGEIFNFAYVIRCNCGVNYFGPQSNFDAGLMSPSAPVVIFSFGYPRIFEVKRLQNNQLFRYRTNLEHGVAMVMKPPTNFRWRWSIPRAKPHEYVSCSMYVVFMKMIAPLPSGVGIPELVRTPSSVTICDPSNASVGRVLRSAKFRENKTGSL